MKKYARVFLTGLAVFLLDRLMKIFFVERNIFISDFFSFRYVENNGASFGILQGHTWLFIIFGFIAVFLIVKFLKDVRERNYFLQFGFGFLLGGVAGNLFDRIFLGYVIDFLDFSFWPVFNLADTFSVVGVFILVLYFFKK